MKAANRVAKNTLILYARMGITVFISLYSTRLILAALGESDFGIYNVVGGAIAMLLFLNNAMSSTTQRYMSYALGEGTFSKQTQIFNTSIVLHICIGVIIVVLLELAGIFFFNSVLNIAPDRIKAAKTVFQFMIISTFFTVISVPFDAVINAHENMFFIAILGIVEAIIKLIIALWITNSSLDRLIVYSLAMASLTIFNLLIKGFFCTYKYPESTIKIKQNLNMILLKNMTNFAGWSLLGTSASMFGAYGQGIIINIFFGTKINAAQGIANQVRGQLSVFSTTMMKALNPIIAKSEGAGNRVFMNKAAMLGSKVSFFLLLVIYVPFIIEMPYILKIWLKEVPDFTIIFCRLLLLRVLIEQQFSILRSSISAVGNIRKFEMLNAPALILPLLISYFLYRSGFPEPTLYLVYLIFEVVNASILIWFAKVNCEISIREYLYNVFLRCTIAFFIVFIFGFIPVVFMKEAWIRFIVTTLISLSAFVISFIFVGFRNDEKEKLKQVLLVLSNRIPIIKRFIK